MLMKRSSYGERDYAFGQAMLSLRTAIGLTQNGLAKHLGVSRRAVGEWEAGSSYPKVQHLKELIALGVKQQAFTEGSEAGEIRALWKAACQKVLLDERCQWRWQEGQRGTVCVGCEDRRVPANVCGAAPRYSLCSALESERGTIDQW